MAYKTADPAWYELLKEFARKNRHNMTLAERVLWDELRANRTDRKFLRQHIVGDYIVDFLCREEGLVIEVDGGYHSERVQQHDDEVRQRWLEKMGYHVMRFSNEEILFDLDRVIDEIDAYFE